MTTPKNPIQPLVTDTHGVVRFKRNSIVSRLFEHGMKTGLGMNEIHQESQHSQDDRIQFAQLIGYSVSGFSELSYVDDATWARVCEMRNQFDGLPPAEPAVRVACITHDGSTLTVLARELEDHLEGLDDNGEGETTYTLTFKTMPLREFEALGEFDGF